MKVSTVSTVAVVETRTKSVLEVVKESSGGSMLDRLVETVERVGTAVFSMVKDSTALVEAVERNPNAVDTDDIMR